jgi:hypothetical protein
MSLSAVSDACIYVVGANNNLQMEQVIRHFQAMMKVISLPKTNLMLEQKKTLF